MRVPPDPRPMIALGLRIKTAKTIAVAVEATHASPRVIDRVEIALSDPTTPHSNQPFHAGLETKLGERDPIVLRACESVSATALRTVGSYIDGLAGKPAHVGIVVNNLNDPTSIGNDHIRAHALEGQLFYRAVEAAVADNGIPAIVVVDKDAYADAQASLELPQATIRSEIARIGKTLGAPWRADHKVAFLAAWIALATA